MFKILLLLNFICAVVVIGNETPGFFLKIAKSIPRIGRRSIKGVEDLYNMPTSLNLPKMQRNQYNDLDNLSRITRKVDESLPKFYYSNIRPIDSKHLSNYIAKDIKSGSDLKFIAWDDFDRALQNDEILFQKFHALGKTQSVEDMLDFLRNTGELSIVSLNNEPQDAKMLYHTSSNMDNNYMNLLNNN